MIQINKAQYFKLYCLRLGSPNNMLSKKCNFPSKTAEAQLMQITYPIIWNFELTYMNEVTIITALRWASCGPGTGLQTHPLKTLYIFGKKFVDELHKSYKNIHDKLYPPLLDFLHCKWNQNDLKCLYFDGIMNSFPNKMSFY